MPGYHNPLALASITGSSRVDEGVDYGVGGGWLTAIADCRIYWSSTSPSGWPGQYVSYQITQAGPLQGAIVYYAEGIYNIPSDRGYRAGGWKICQLAPGGSIEIGFGSTNPPDSWARAYGSGYDQVNSTGAGILFNQLLGELGAPTGQVQGSRLGATPPYDISGISGGGPVSGGGGGGGSVQAGPIPEASYDSADIIREAWWEFGVHGQRAYDNANDIQRYFNGINVVTFGGPQ